jgi:hypothetical protein
VSSARCNIDPFLLNIGRHNTQSLNHVDHQQSVLPSRRFSKSRDVCSKA